MYKRRRRRTGKGKKKSEQESSVVDSLLVTTTTATTENEGQEEEVEESEVIQEVNQEQPANMSVTSSVEVEESQPKSVESNHKAVGARKRKTTPISKVKIVEKARTDCGIENGVMSDPDEPLAMMKSNHNNNNNNSPPYKKPCVESQSQSTRKNGMIRSIVTELKSAKESKGKLDNVLLKSYKEEREEDESDDRDGDEGSLRIEEDEEREKEIGRGSRKRRNGGVGGPRRLGNGWEESQSEDGDGDRDGERDGTDDGSEEEDGTDLRHNHSQDPPFRCGVCAYGSCDKSTLLRHMRTHSGERPFQCRLCFFAFTTKANCERHLRNRHGQIDKDQVRNLVVCLPSSESETENGENGENGDMDMSSPKEERKKKVESHHVDKFQTSSAPSYVRDRSRDRDRDSEESKVMNLTKPFNFDRGYLSLVKIPDDQPLDLSMDAVDLSTKRASAHSAHLNHNSNRVDLHLHRPRPIYPMPEIPLLTSPFAAKREPTLHPQISINPFTAHSLRPADLNGTIAPPPFSIFPFGAPPGYNPFVVPQMDKLIPPKISNAFMPPSPPGSFGSAEPVPDVEDMKEMETKSVPSPAPRKKSEKTNGEYQKPKQRRYRTERPFACPHCPARFTLRSNMERHGKHQHPTVWQRSPSNRVINRQKSQQSPLVGSPTLVPQQKFTSTLTNGDGSGDGSDRGSGKSSLVKIPKVTSSNVDVRAVIAQQLKRKLSNSSIRVGNEKVDGSDLASVSQLLDGVKSSSFAQYFEGDHEEVEEEEEDMEEGEEGEGESDEGSSDEGDSSKQDSSGGEKKKSAYSSAPHKISCPHCTRRFPWTSSLRRHLLTHTGQKPFQCSECSLLFTTKSNCDRHLARKHGGGPGGGNGGQKGSEEDEEEEGEDEDEDEGQVEEGQQIPSDEPEPKTPARPLVAVVKSTSANSGGSPGEDVSFRCHLCEASSSEREALLAHMESDHQETFKMLVSKGALNSPLSENSENESGADVAHRKVICSFCVRRFWSVEDLRRHIRSHSGERPFTCPHCSRRFTLKHSMLRHLKKHAELNGIGADVTVTPTTSVTTDKEKKSGTDLIGRLLGIKDKHLVEQLLSRPDAKGAAKLLGVRRPVAAKI